MLNLWRKCTYLVWNKRISKKENSTAILKMIIQGIVYHKDSSLLSQNDLWLTILLWKKQRYSLKIKEGLNLQRVSHLIQECSEIRMDLEGHRIMVIALMDCLSIHSMKLRKWKNLKLDQYLIPSILGRSSLLRIVITLRITISAIINLGINLILRILQCLSREDQNNQRNMKTIKKIHINQQQ